MATLLSETIKQYVLGMDCGVRRNAAIAIKYGEKEGIKRFGWAIHTRDRIPPVVWVDTYIRPTVQRYTTSRVFASQVTIKKGDSSAGILDRARVAELADARDLGSRGQPWGFKSPLSHHYYHPTRQGVRFRR